MEKHLVEHYSPGSYHGVPKYKLNYVKSRFDPVAALLTLSQLCFVGSGECDRLLKLLEPDIDVTAITPGQ